MDDRKAFLYHFCYFIDLSTMRFLNCSEVQNNVICFGAINAGNEARVYNNRKSIFSIFSYIYQLLMLNSKCNLTK